MRLGLGLGMVAESAAGGGPAPPAVPSSIRFATVNEAASRRCVFATQLDFAAHTANISRALTIWYKLDSGITAGDPGMFGEDSNTHNVQWRRSTDRIARRIAATTADQWLPPKATWRHFTIVGPNSGTTWRCYDNGNLGPTTSQTVAGFFTHIGRRGTADSWRGLLCECTFWSTRLSSAQAAALCPGGAFVDPMDPAFDSYGRIHHWRMGLGDAFPTVQDLVGSNHLTMEGLTNASFIADHP